MNQTGEGEPETVRTFREYTDDFVETRDQDKKLPGDYAWLHSSRLYHLGAALCYAGSLVFTFFYSRLALPVRIENRQVLKECGQSGFFLYGNHTQPVGDVFTPTRVVFPRRMYTICDPSNLGIPVLGKLLPMMGALPIPDTLSGMRKFLDAVGQYVKNGHCILIYPEAHVWPWCTFVRPFPATSFRYPVQFGVPVYCMTTTYQKRQRRKKPCVTIYLDGPFYPDPDLSSRQAQKKLCDEVTAAMQERSKESTCEYIRYVKESEG